MTQGTVGGVCCFGEAFFYGGPGSLARVTPIFFWGLTPFLVLYLDEINPRRDRYLRCAKPNRLNQSCPQGTEPLARVARSSRLGVKMPPLPPPPSRSLSLGGGFWGGVFGSGSGSLARVAPLFVSSLTSS